MAKVPFYNAEGYPDPTAHHAMQNVLKEQEEADAECAALIRMLKGIIDAHGFDILNRIEVRHRKTGREYR